MNDDPITHLQNIQGQTYPGYGGCIYCGSDGGTEGLRDEHIIPFSLGGNTTIKKASCRVCEQILNRVDTHLARSVYGQFRIHANVQTRNPEVRPLSLPVTLTIDEEERKLSLPVADHPYALALPIWGEAGILRCAPIDANFPDVFWHVYYWTPPNIRETLGLAETKDFRIWQSGRVDAALFARGIAKIAYCHAVLRYGIDGFRPLAIPDLILGKFSAVSHFVGVQMNDPPPAMPGKAFHAIHFSELTPKLKYDFDNQRWIKLYLVSVRLFANSASQQYGMPIYHVIVGAPKLTRGNPC